MKEWQHYIIFAPFLTILGIGVIAYSQSIYVSTWYKTFLGIPYEVDPQYYSSLINCLCLVASGYVIIGVGLGLLVSTYDIYRLENKLQQALLEKNTQPPVFRQKRYCNYCGTITRKDSKFCEKCGKQISET